MATVTVTEPAGQSCKPATRKLVLRGFDGLTWRDVATAPPRDCTAEEVPVLDLAGIYGDLAARKAVAEQFLHAAETTGFFYVKNHGIPQDRIDAALDASRKFFHLPSENKMQALMRPEVSNYGYMPIGSRQANPSESKDQKESFSFHYEPRLDPRHSGHLDAVPQRVLDALPQDRHILWADCGAPGFHAALLAYYQAVLVLARRMMGIVALALALPEDYFAVLTEFPGADLAANFYPGRGEADSTPAIDEVGLGAHTDLQVLTFLYQSDDEKGLQVLTRGRGEWVYAPPVPGTFVVNIGDILMRLTNDRLHSTVHRVVQHSRRDRLSLPVFFGFGFDAPCVVAPTCVSATNPAKYPPETCGALVSRRLNMGNVSV